MLDVAVIGGGIAGLATAARLQARGLTTVVFEAHAQAGGCAGFYRRRGFAFDVGATTLVDFEPGGVGGELLEAIGLPPVEGEALPGYVAWLPDRRVTLFRDPVAWAAERERACGASSAHVAFWRLLDRLADVFWSASRAGVKLPLRTAGDIWRALRCVGMRNVTLLRYVNQTIGDSLRRFGLRREKPLSGLLSMLLEDTVHAGIDEAPLINAALGITIRGAGLTRARGGMFGFCRRFISHYRALGGDLRLACPVRQVERLSREGFRLRCSRGEVIARQVVCAVPIEVAAKLSPPEIGRGLRPYLLRDAKDRGGAIVVFLGALESEVAGQDFTHHQLLQDYDKPLGNGNNMFVSVSAAGDLESAPVGHRSVMISTHCDLSDWEGLSAEEYRRRKTEAGARLVAFARRAYPDLGRQSVVYEIGTPHSYERFTGRPRGAVGGVRQTLRNSNQHAVPHETRLRGFWLVGDTTWPGLGTVACVLGSRLVAEGVLSLFKGRLRQKPASLVPRENDREPASRT